jgi:phosphatidylserine/phosphatidylglycerophosphate/cardiolipin synthase-like enzyme
MRDRASRPFAGRGFGTKGPISARVPRYTSAVSRSLGLLLALLAASRPAGAQLRAALSRTSTPAPVVLASPALVQPSAALPRALAPIGAAALAPALAQPSFAPGAALAAPVPVAALSAVPAAAALGPALALPSARALAGAPEGLAAGRLFDGAAARSEGPVPVPSAGEPAPAPRGDSVVLNGTRLPSRLFTDQSKASVELIKAIDATRKTLDIALHGLALREVMDALRRAKARGVKIRVVMNQTHAWPEKPGQERAPEVQALMDEGFDMRVLRGGDQFGVMHNKFAVFDGAVVQTGSYNWTHAADSWHWENLLFLDEASTVRAFGDYWAWMWSRSADARRKPRPVEFDAEGRTPEVPPAPEPAVPSVRFNGEAFPSAAFSPKSAEAWLIRALDAARESVELANFSFTSEPLRDALVRARDRGVRIRIVFDRDQYRYLDQMKWIVDQGFDARLATGKDGRKGVMHNKFALFDGRLLETGSHNWTTNAHKNNYENLVFLASPDDLAAYRAYFGRLWKAAIDPTPDDHLGPQSAPEDFNPLH